MTQPQTTNLQKLLGELELEVMEQLWVLEENRDVTVREVITLLQQDRQVAYTTVMTVMGHLAGKGLLTRSALDGKTHLYRVALTREEFLARSSQHMVDTLVEEFGDLALAQFIAAVEKVDPEKLRRLRQALGETVDESTEGSESSATSEAPPPDLPPHRIKN
ncbi:MAG: BlaI/MecI/CopY family transcriptional regulator [Chloroflexia bacterium]